MSVCVFVLKSFTVRIAVYCKHGTIAVRSRAKVENLLSLLLCYIELKELEVVLNVGAEFLVERCVESGLVCLLVERILDTIWKHVMIDEIGEGWQDLIRYISRVNLSFGIGREENDCREKIQALTAKIKIVLPLLCSVFGCWT